MSLATRCSSCGTAFRVVQDQLKVSEGWVRCGRCNAVFNAIEGLFDLGRDPPAETGERNASHAERAAPTREPSERAAPSRTAEFEKTLRSPPAAEAVSQPAMRSVEKRAAATNTDSIESSGDDVDSTGDLGELLADPIDARLFGPRKRAEHAHKPPAELGGRDRVEFSDARFDSDLFADNSSENEADLVVLPATDAGALPLESEAHPEFIRRADRRARWQSGAARAAFGGLALLAAAMLVLQVSHHYRDTIAASWPSLRAPLVAWCRVAGCRIEAPRRIEDVVVESTALTRAPAPDTFVLSVTLRSRSAIALGMPSIDLALTDATGGLVARRVLAPEELHAAEVLAPHAESSLQVPLTAGPAAVVGYTVEIFYP
ncbi:MAG TPA: zinc-ribbon and DUF3426 domain-containing protein [Caldimonas sp.]|jgi:predicted Zn finger-like uncharacterized protein|nr:zinc-ribbon and DUF3426 domain-containing protein [Caldimonas sp.]HEX4233198.1 zinc-ribbon and DUF3426 domain-containing protein [Caldimonas sp.]